MKVCIMWFRRDLRVDDNTALARALVYAAHNGCTVIPLFIVDEEIVSALPRDDARVSFIYDQLCHIDQYCRRFDSGLLIEKGAPLAVWDRLFATYDVQAVFYNKDYEPYARNRDRAIKELARDRGVAVNAYKDQVIFEPNEIVKADGNPYTVFTPYKKRWLQAFGGGQFVAPTMDWSYLHPATGPLPSLEAIGFRRAAIVVPPICWSAMDDYAAQRDYPASGAATGLGPHLRFGTISVRAAVNRVQTACATLLSELIWREFFTQVLFHFPRVVDSCFRPKYEAIPWRNDPDDFQRWCEGRTGYPLVDAGMRELNQTGRMHNRVRMVVASFLCKHLLIDWRWGERYFAQHLLDYDLSANNGNWQWAAGTGCDAAPYFRVFNPSEQLRKFDAKAAYVSNWVPEYGTQNYCDPIVEHKAARLRALDTYKQALALNSESS